jgi:hypothetical protein
MTFIKYRKNIERKKLKKSLKQKPSVNFSRIPLQFKHRVEDMQNKLGTNFEWTSSGEVILDGIYYPGTNITDLLLYHIKEKKPKKAPFMYKVFKKEFVPWLTY